MIFVTGAAGFIGSNFVIDWLDPERVAADEPVQNFVALTYVGNLANLASVRSTGGCSSSAGTSAVARRCWSCRAKLTCSTVPGLVAAATVGRKRMLQRRERIQCDERRAFA
jgi:hypothetical protein